MFGFNLSKHGVYSFAANLFRKYMSANNNLENLNQKGIITFGKTALKVEVFNQTVRDAFERYSEVGNAFLSALHRQGIKVDPTSIVKNWENRSWFSDGLKCEVLQPGEHWQKGKLRVKVAIEFVHDAPEADLPLESPLDEIRQMMDDRPSNP